MAKSQRVITIGYKVVRVKQDGSYVSVIPGWLDKVGGSKYKVAYRIGEFVKPRIVGTRLFAFTSLKEALTYRVDRIWLGDAPLKIFKAELVNFHNNGWLSGFLKSNSHGCLSLRQLQQWFKSNDDKPDYLSSGTCTAIKLIEEELP